ncbi:hypothetical protein [Tsukamurella asaccharolytica]|uniref:hypothetical protein n=1 Tax=Tsukamurella asaccharolytica TaxID=2592067 RepID=UPI0013155A12|nr:hypothetical protein [Tsukamurella asaccharolytica]
MRPTHAHRCGRIRVLIAGALERVRDIDAARGTDAHLARVAVAMRHTHGFVAETGL